MSPEAGLKNVSDNFHTLFLNEKTQYHVKSLKKLLEKHSVTTVYAQNKIRFIKDEKSVSFFLSDENAELPDHRGEKIIPLDQLVRQPWKIMAMVLTKLKLNKIIFARNCDVRKTDRAAAEEFLNTWHVMNATQSAFNLGLYYRGELIALASFSKGRKMKRLPEHKRSFELIRFCCKSGITVTGGLTKLVKNFCRLKDAGDIMTYVDKQLSDGRSFISAGFKKHGETESHYFLVSKSSFERTPTDKDKDFDPRKFYKLRDSGNIKLVYTPGELL